MYGMPMQGGIRRAGTIDNRAGRLRASDSNGMRMADSVSRQSCQELSHSYGRHCWGNDASDLPFADRPAHNFMVNKARI